VKLFGNLEVPFNAPRINGDRKRELFLFQKKSQIRFKNLSLLNLAFCHRSFANEYKGKTDNNERLEFLGDSVLGLVMADYLFHHLPDNVEGDLAKIKSYVVSEPSLADKARELGVNEFLLLGRGEDHSGGRDRDAILADAMEAIIGAYYLDGGFKPVTDFVIDLLKDQVHNVLLEKHDRDFKTLLQELVQKEYKICPKYFLVKTEGPDHDRVFHMEVRIQDQIFGPGIGKNKKKAEQAAAELAFTALDKDG